MGSCAEHNRRWLMERSKEGGRREGAAMADFRSLQTSFGMATRTTNVVSTVTF